MLSSGIDSIVDLCILLHLHKNIAIELRSWLVHSEPITIMWAFEKVLMKLKNGNLNRDIFPLWMLCRFLKYPELSYNCLQFNWMFEGCALCIISNQSRHATKTIHREWLHISYRPIKITFRHFRTFIPCAGWIVREQLRTLLTRCIPSSVRILSFVQ